MTTHTHTHILIPLVICMLIAHTHISTPASPSHHLAHTYMHTYQMGDGCDGTVSLKKRQIFSYQNRNTKKKNREEGGKESD